MTKTRVGRAWHITTLVVAVFALLLQLFLVARGETVLDSSAVTTPRTEQLRRLFSYFTIQSNILVAASMWLVVRDRTGSQLFRVLRLASLIGITVTGLVAAVALPPSPTYTPANRTELVNVSGYRTFRQVAWAGSFEGISSIGLGVRARLPFRVLAVTGIPGSTNGTRVVIDVAHAW